MDYFSLTIGFFTGLFVLHMIYYLTDFGQVGLFLKEAERSSLLLLVMAAESIGYIQTLKYETMKELGVPENTIKTTKNIDDYNFRAWKMSSVSKLLGSYPDRYKHIPKYVNWQTAMEVLDDLHKHGQRSKDAKE